MAAALAVLLIAALGTTSAQSTRRPRRETTATRKARIAKTIQQTYGHPWEAAGGGGYMRYRSGQYQQQDNQVSFWATTRYTLNSLSPKLGILGTVQGSYGKARIGNISLVDPPYAPISIDIPNPQISEYAFMAGPSWRFIGREKFAVSGFAQAGLDLGKFAGGSKGFSAADIGVWQGDFAPAFSAGVSLDYNIDTSFALRVSPAYLGTTFGSTMQNSKALNIGIVYRFGKSR